MRQGQGRTTSTIAAGPFHVSRIEHDAGLRLGTHDHEVACIHYVTAGVYCESTRTRRYRLGAGKILLKPPGLPHWNEFTRGSRALRIDFPAEACEDGGAALPAAAMVHDRPRETSWLCSRILDELRAGDDASRLSLHGLCLQLLGELLPPRSNGPRAVPPDVRRCEAYLRERFREPVRFGDIARDIGLSRSHLAVAFRRYRRCTPGAFLRRVRVEHAMRLMDSTELSLAEIAVDCGFSDQSHLSRVFRAAIGCTPGAWRTRRRS